MSRLPFQFIEFDLGHEASLNINTHKHIYPYSHWWHQILESKIEPFREAIDRKKRGGRRRCSISLFYKRIQREPKFDYPTCKTIISLTTNKQIKLSPKKDLQSNKGKAPWTRARRCLFDDMSCSFVLIPTILFMQPQPSLFMQSSLTFM